MTSLMDIDANELNRRALIADLGATLAEERAFRDHVEIVEADMPVALACAIDERDWIVEPAGGDVALRLAGLYGSGRRRRIVAIFMRSAAAALKRVPPTITDPWSWAEISVMNVGSIACTPSGQAAGPGKRPSQSALDCRERGCRGIALRGAGRCVVCAEQLGPVPVNGAVVDRMVRPTACPAHSISDTRYVTDAMALVIERCSWLLDEAMTLDVALLPRPLARA